MATEGILIDFRSRGARAVQRDMHATGVAARKAGQGIAKLAKGLVALAAAGAVVSFFTKATQAARSFEKAMAEVSTLTETIDMKSLSEEVRLVSVSFGQMPTAQAKAAYQIISAGASNSADAISTLNAANKLAIGGVTDVTTAADGLTSVLNAYGNQVGSVSEVSDKFFVAVKGGKTTVDELSSSIGLVAPIAAQAGASLTEMLSGIAALTKGGIQTAQATAGLRLALSAVIKPSSEATKEAQRLGLSFDAAALKQRGFAGLLDQVREKTGGSVESMAKLFGQVQALAAVLTLTGTGAKDFKDSLDAMASSAGATDEAYKKMANTSDQKLNKAMASFSNLMITVGNQVLPEVASGMTAVAKVANFFGAVFVAATKLISTSFSNIKFLFEQFRLQALLAIGKVGIYLQELPTNIKLAFLKAFNFIKIKYGEFIQFLADSTPSFASSMKESLQKVATVLKKPIESIKKIEEAQRKQNGVVKESISLYEKELDILQKQNAVLNQRAAIDVSRAFKASSSANSLLDGTGVSLKEKDSISRIKKGPDTTKIAEDAIDRQRQKTELSTKALQDQEGRVKKLKDTFAGYGETIGGVFQSAISGTESFGSAFGKMAIKIVADIAKIGLQRSLSSGFASGFGSLGGDISKIFGGLFGGARAEGGPVQKGKIHLVGERGPELFSPSSSGSIIPNHQLERSQAASVNNQNININTTVNVTSQASEPGRVASETSRALTESIKAVVKGELFREMRPGGMLAQGG